MKKGSMTSLHLATVIRVERPLPVVGDAGTGAAGISINTTTTDTGTTAGDHTTGDLMRQSPPPSTTINSSRPRDVAGDGEELASRVAVIRIVRSVVHVNSNNRGSIGEC